MKKAFLILTLNLFLFCNGQDNKNKKNYYIKYNYLIVTDSKNSTITKPNGIDVRIVQDTFFKTFEIVYTNDKSEIEVLNLQFIREIKPDYWLMKDSFGNKFYVFNHLEENYFTYKLVEKLHGLDWLCKIVDKKEE